MLLKRKVRLGRLLETPKVFCLHLGKKRCVGEAVKLTISFIFMALGLK